MTSAADHAETIRVLLVDDQELFRRGLRMVLEADPGLEIEEAEDGLSAVAKATASPPDVVLLDVRMPGMNGPEAAGAIKEAAPSARIGHIGLYRDPKTLVAVEYYFKVPGEMTDRDVIVVDPMLATGNSAVAAVDRIKETNPRSIKFVCLLTCPEGIKAFHTHHPDVPIYTAAIDECLNEKSYIVPGLGDAGDRLFGTK